MKCSYAIQVVGDEIKWQRLGSREEGATEMYAGGENQISELATPTTGRHDHKDRPQSFAAELPSPQPVFEMMGDTGYTGGRTPPPQQRGPSPYQRTPNR